MKRFLFLCCCSVFVLLWGGQRCSALVLTDTVKVTLSGKNFTPQSSVFIDSRQFTPEYINSNTLRISVPRSMITSAQPNNVRVVNPSAGGGSSNNKPMVVTCRTAEPTQLASFSMTIKTTMYGDISEPINEENLQEGQKLILSHSRMPYNSRTVMSGKYFRDGNSEVHVSLVPDADNPFVPHPVSSSPSELNRIYMNSASGQAIYYNGANQVIHTTPIDSVPLKPITDYLRTILAQINAPDSGAAAPAGGASSAAAGGGSGSGSGAALPAPTDTNIRKSIYLADAYKSGVPITQISPGRYKIQYQRAATPVFPITQTIRMYVKSPEDYIERYEIFRDNRLQFRIRYVYDNPVPGTFVPRLRRTISSDFYVLEGLPMKHVTVNDFEDFTLSITQ